MVNPSIFVLFEAVKVILADIHHFVDCLNHGQSTATSENLRIKETRFDRGIVNKCPFRFPVSCGTMS